MSNDTATPEPVIEEAEMDMGALLASEAAQATSLRRGEIVEGVVMGASADGLIVDVGTKTEGVIPQSEMLSLGAEGATKLSAGDTVKVMVQQPSSAEGHAIVSLDRARGEEGWDTLAARLESGEIFEAEVTGHNRGGIMVNVDGVNAFVPLSQVDSIRRDDPEAASQLQNLVGKAIRLKVMELNRKRNRVILSERAAMAEHRKEERERIIEELQEGEIREGRVSSITDFGVFIDLGGADGLAHMTELTWERGKKAKDLFNIGDVVQAYVLKVDREAKKISLSLKRAQPEKWDDTVSRFVIGQVLVGKVTKLMAFGAFVRLDGPVEGLIHISELSNRRITHPKEIVKEGDVVPVKLVRVERDRHRLGLSLRQARNDAEAMGFAFDANGAVIDYPDDVREEHGMPPRDKAVQRRPEPRTPQEAIERAVEREPEPVSAFAAAMVRALENAETGNTIVRDAASFVGGGIPAEPEAVAAEPVAEMTPPAETVADETVATAEPVVEEAVTASEPATEAASVVADEVADASGEPSAKLEETPAEAESAEEQSEVGTSSRE
ncbi:MAG: S1 RNA-binding domain-containing protein [Dehalococcoidia bacterium]